MGGVLQKKRNIHTEDTTSMEKKESKKNKGIEKQEKKEKVPSIELANFDSIV